MIYKPSAQGRERERNTYRHADREKERWMMDKVGEREKKRERSGVKET